ncbi:MAG: PD-(D/E)XK nuclease family protein [Sulfurimonas sp.]|jgi:hypothetical protein
MSERTIEEYSQFFEEVKNFQVEQQKQKMRGLNDYNMVNVVRKENAEVGMHSNVIYSLIDPNGLHYQDDLFLKLFIQEVLTDIKDDFGEIISVYAEESTNENRRIDFTIKSSKYYIGIEMKIDAKDLQDQLSHYENDLKEKANQDNQQTVRIYYLTKDGKEAAPRSRNDITYLKVSFAKHILNWINKCQVEVRNITNLNEAFENYKDIVKKITNQYRGNIMLLEDELLRNNENFELAKDISKAYQKAWDKLEKLFVDKVILDIEKLNFNIQRTDRDSFHCLDIKEKYFIKVFRNEDGVTMQITDKDSPFSIVDENKKALILNHLQTIANFTAGWPKVYALLLIPNSDIDKFDYLDLISKIVSSEL